MFRSSAFILIALLVCLLTAAGARTYIVDDDGFANFKTIGEAVVASSNGDTIYIKPGTYKEQVILNKSLKLMPLTGESEPIILRGDGRAIGIRIESDSCSIEGLTLENYTGPGISVQSSGNVLDKNRFEKDNPAIMVHSSSKNEISNNILQDCQGGVVLWDSSNDTVSKNKMDGGEVSILLRDSSRTSVEANKAGGSATGIWLMNSSNIAISSNDVDCKAYGIWLLNSSASSLSDNRVLIVNNASPTSSGLYLLNSSGFEAAGNAINGGLFGIGVFNSSDGRISKNTVNSSLRGIYLLNDGAQEISNNSIKDVAFGIAMEGSSGNTVQDCTVENSTRALGLATSAGNRILENHILKTRDTALEMDSSTGNLIANNEISDSDKGFIILDSSANSIEANSFRKVSWGLYVEGSARESFNNSIPESNLIDGKPVVYLYAQSDKLIKNAELAHLTLAYCSNINVENSAITNDAVFLFSSSGNEILGNNISRCYGMRLLDSDKNAISNNTMIGNRYSGMFLVSSNGNQIDGNNASLNEQNGISLINCSKNILSDNIVDHNNDSGIWINLSDNNQIYQNNITRNLLGVDLMSSSENSIYHNNFIDNKDPAQDRDGNNAWDMGNITGGNYWSGHFAKGNPSQNWPRLIKGGKMDNYPFQDVSGWMQAAPGSL